MKIVFSISWIKGNEKSVVRFLLLFIWQISTFDSYIRAFFYYKNVIVRIFLNFISKFFVIDKDGVNNVMQVSLRFARLSFYFVLSIMSVTFNVTLNDFITCRVIKLAAWREFNWNFKLIIILEV